MHKEIKKENRLVEIDLMPANYPKNTPTCL